MLEDRQEKLCFWIASGSILFITLFYNTFGFIENSHGWVTSEQLSMILRATPENGLVGYRNWFASGKMEYFPKVPFINFSLFHILISPFTTPIDRLQAARAIMSLVFAVNFGLVYLFFRNFFPNWKIVLASTVVGFSGQFICYFGDMVAPEQFTLLAYLISAIALYKLDQNSKSKLAWCLLIISTFFGYVLISTLCVLIWTGLKYLNYFKNRNGENLAAVKFATKVCAIVCLLSFSFLAYNIYSEAKLRDVPITETDIFSSSRRRLDIQSEYEESLGHYMRWHNYFVLIAKRVAMSFVPYIFRVNIYLEMLFFILLAVPLFLKRKVILPMVKNTKVWTPALVAMIPLLLACCHTMVILRGYAAPHSFSAMLYVVPCTLVWLLFFTFVHLKNRKTLIAITLMVFALSQFSITQKKNLESKEPGEILREFNNIHEILPTAPQNIAYPGGYNYLYTNLPFIIGYYLNEHKIDDIGKADYIISRQRDNKEGSLMTPSHKHVFLYKRTKHDL